MYKPAARSSCSFKTTQVARWFPHSIAPFHPLQCMGSPEEKMYLFSVFKHHACQSSYFQPYKLEIGNQYSIYWAYKKSIFPKFKNRAGMPNNNLPEWTSLKSFILKFCISIVYATLIWLLQILIWEIFYLQKFLVAIFLDT